jgi:hypothetical protein
VLGITTKVSMFQEFAGLQVHDRACNGTGGAIGGIIDIVVDVVVLEECKRVVGGNLR